MLSLYDTLVLLWSGDGIACRGSIFWHTFVQYVYIGILISIPRPSEHSLRMVVTCVLRGIVYVTYSWHTWSMSRDTVPRLPDHPVTCHARSSAGLSRGYHHNSCVRTLRAALSRHVTSITFNRPTFRVWTVPTTRLSNYTGAVLSTFTAMFV